MKNKVGLFALLGFLVLGEACTISMPGSSGVARVPQNSNDNASDGNQGNVQSVPLAGYYIETIEFGTAVIDDEQLTDFGRALGFCSDAASNSVVNDAGTMTNWYSVGENGIIIEICNLNDQTNVAICSEPACQTEFVVVEGCLIQEAAEDCEPQDAEGDENDAEDDGSGCSEDQYLFVDYNDETSENAICVSLETELVYECDQFGSTVWTAEGKVITTHIAQDSMTMVDTFGFCADPGETLEINQGDQQAIEQSYLHILNSTTQDVEELGFIRL